MPVSKIKVKRKKKELTEIKYSNNFENKHLIFCSSKINQGQIEPGKQRNNTAPCFVGFVILLYGIHLY